MGRPPLQLTADEIVERLRMQRRGWNASYRKRRAALREASEQRLERTRQAILDAMSPEERAWHDAEQAARLESQRCYDVVRSEHHRMQMRGYARRNRARANGVPEHELPPKPASWTETVAAIARSGLTMEQVAAGIEERAAREQREKDEALRRRALELGLPDYLGDDTKLRIRAALMAQESELPDGMVNDALAATAPLPVPPPAPGSQVYAQHPPLTPAPAAAPAYATVSGGAYSAMPGGAPTPGVTEEEQLT